MHVFSLWMMKILLLPKLLLLLLLLSKLSFANYLFSEGVCLFAKASLVPWPLQKGMQAIRRTGLWVEKKWSCLFCGLCVLLVVNVFGDSITCLFCWFVFVERWNVLIVVCSHFQNSWVWSQKRKYIYIFQTCVVVNLKKNQGLHQQFPRNHPWIKKMKSDEIWWNLMKSDEIIIFHQISSDFIRFVFLCFFLTSLFQTCFHGKKRNNLYHPVSSKNQILGSTVQTCNHFWVSFLQRIHLIE